MPGMCMFCFSVKYRFYSSKCMVNEIDANRCKLQVEISKCIWREVDLAKSIIVGGLNQKIVHLFPKV